MSFVDPPNQNSSPSFSHEQLEDVRKRLTGAVLRQVSPEVAARLKHSRTLRSHGCNSTFKYFTFWDKNQPGILDADHFSYRLIYDPHAIYHKEQKASGKPYRFNISFYANRIRIYHHREAILEALTEAVARADIEGFEPKLNNQQALILIHFFEASSVRELEDELLEYLPRLVMEFHPVYSKVIDLYGSDLPREEVKSIIAAREKVYVRSQAAPEQFKKYAHGVPPALKAQVLNRDGNKCVKCLRSGAQLALHADHIIPWSKGGLTLLENLQALCQPCNNAKGNRDSTDYRQ